MNETIPGNLIHKPLKKNTWWHLANFLKPSLLIFSKQILFQTTSFQ